ncbi:cytosolic enolase [Thalictrum thalictroides]|uniref:Cytosolic enolase n=1 Tax=Thalictrum thalictroides TaxID=46969 RepID=A0A7J6VE23_THATH|nr:cytosolic enolase [Thalictrum thalictroides]
MSVQEYLDEHTLSRKIEDAVNAAVRAKAPDPVLFIESSPLCDNKDQSEAHILDGRGILTVEVESKDSYLGRLIPTVTLSVS